jgi:HTH-type transcriptional repressor of NAD biosynthesis genes
MTEVMNYFDPPKLSGDVLAKAGIDKVQLIPIKPHENSAPLSCLDNVKKYIECHGGEVQLGWIFSILGNLALKLTAHAVVKQKDGSLLCVTPNAYRNDTLKFAPDDSVSTLIQNDFLPLKFVPLVNDRVLNDYLDIEREQDSFRLNSGGYASTSDLQEFYLRATALYPQILALAKKHTGVNDLCYCGSGKKRKKCCR